MRLSFCPPIPYWLVWHWSHFAYSWTPYIVQVLTILGERKNGDIFLESAACRPLRKALQPLIKLTNRKHFKGKTEKVGKWRSMWWGSSGGLIADRGHGSPTTLTGVPGRQLYEEIRERTTGEKARTRCSVGSHERCHCTVSFLVGTALTWGCPLPRYINKTELRNSRLEVLEKLQQTVRTTL